MNGIVVTFILTALIWGLIIGYIVKKKKKPKFPAGHHTNTTYKQPEDLTEL